VLGHASLATTAIYVQAEKKRVLEEVSMVLEIRTNLAASG
jgi:site-specific recombinase XerD